MDLSTTTVLFDFDGTISRRDIGVVLLEEAGDPEWRRLDELYARGEIGSQECMERQLAMLTGTLPELLAIARSVPLDPAAGPLIRGLLGAGAEVMVASDGFGFYVEDRIAELEVEVPVLTNAVCWDDRAMEFPNAAQQCPCSSCGTCKQAPLRDARHAGRTTVFVGDGISDRKAALLAEVLFATDRLASWCELNGVDHVPFDSLSDVARHLGVPVEEAHR